MEIVTDRLLLRRARPEDIDDFFVILSQPAAVRYWSTPPHESKAVTQDWLDSMLEGPAAGRDEFVVVYEGRVVGKFGCYQPPELGFIFSPQVWGKGIAREAGLAYLEHARKGPLTHLIADVDPRNEACLGLLMRLGFKKTGTAERTWLVGEEWCDSVYLRLDF